MKVVYIAGAYRAVTVNGIRGNIEKARALAVEVWRLGAAALCPHCNTAFMDGIVSDKTFLEGDLELLRRCDAVLTVPGWTDSSGAVAEVDLARALKLPIYESLTGLKTWLAWKAVQAEAQSAAGPAVLTIAVMEDLFQKAHVDGDQLIFSFTAGCCEAIWKAACGHVRLRKSILIPEPAETTARQPYFNDTRSDKYP